MPRRLPDSSRLLAPPHGELAAAFRHVPGIAVGDGDESDLVAERRPFGRDARGADVAVVGVRADGHDPKGRLRIGPGRRDRASEVSRTMTSDAHQNLRGRTGILLLAC